ncbi:hypothetical protein OG735_03185 [Streptomyces sp. NBC_01210]|uniref:hypothetical protein n=1 Tax=Streptomyces sp. NBC_01210 TaxID=2903774 RepID=UPI002E0F4B3E|nr:hypothetical protein OG735_03185 [Streptomyces sp. NBC_01210]
MARKIAETLKDLNATRFDLKYGMNGMSHHALMTNIELFGTKVAPPVRGMMDSWRPGVRSSRLHSRRRLHVSTPGR